MRRDPRDKSDLWGALAAPLAGGVALTSGALRERFDAVVPGEWDFTLELLPPIAAHGVDVCAFKATLTILGVKRQEVGTGRDYPAAAETALVRCAGLFGIRGDVPSAAEAPAPSARATVAPATSREAAATAMTLEQALAYPFPFRRGTPQHGKPLRTFEIDGLQEVAEWIGKRQRETGNPDFHAEPLAAITMVLAHLESLQTALPLDMPAVEPPADGRVPPPGPVSAALAAPQAAPDSAPAPLAVVELTRQLCAPLDDPRLPAGVAKRLRRQLGDGDLRDQAALERAVDQVREALGEPPRATTAIAHPESVYVRTQHLNALLQRPDLDVKVAEHVRRQLINGELATGDALERAISRVERELALPF
ncbi:hypothetical protein [Roseisolibacter agri]|nr:hypothetical protein [Roseisolibacter agri]